MANPSFHAPWYRWVCQRSHAGDLKRQAGGRCAESPSRLLAGMLLLAGVCGCTITQTANPVSYRDGDAREICLIEEPRVFGAFLPAYRAALERKGLAVTTLRPGAPLTSCPFTSTYYARQSWDFVTYMSHAVIKVYHDGTETGEALYDAPKAGFALTFRIYETTESKVTTMVDQLFPSMPGK